MASRTAATVLICALSACTQQSPGSPDIQVREAWARPSAPGQSNGAAYVVIDNRGTGGDRLVAAAAPEVASSAMLHTTSVSDGIARMRMAEGVDLPAGEVTAMSPGGTHVMLMGLKSPLRTGDAIRLQLTFDQSGRREVQAVVREAGAS